MEIFRKILRGDEYKMDADPAGRCKVITLKY